MLLVTKHFIPQVHSSHVARKTLLRQLDSAFECKLTLVAAAAGSGKTTLVADWSKQYAESVCWLSLDGRDNDPVRFLAYVANAIQTRLPDFGTTLLSALLSPQPPTVENALHSLVNQLAMIPEPLVLVLDDYHVIENRDVHQQVMFLLDYLPPQLHLVVLTRIDPPFPLSRLRARGELLEIRADMLRFSLQEVKQFLNIQMGFDLSSKQVEALEARTEGWIAGLQLAALAMQTGDRQKFIQSFTGSHRFILDYLVEEVLRHQPEHVRQFLLYTSFLQRLNADLCNVVTGETNGQAMLELVERHHLFLIPLDTSRQWYRYHHLFADLLQSRFIAEISLHVRNTLWRRAAQWHEANGDAMTAIDYSLQGEDYRYATQIMTGSGLHLMRGSEVTLMLGWYRQFPQAFLREEPRLCLLFGLAFALNGRWDEAERLLEMVEHHQLPDSEALLLMYLVGSYRGDATRLSTIMRQPPKDRIAKLVYGLLLSTQGDFEHACEFLIESQGMSQREGDETLALTTLFHLCRLRVFMGRLHEAYDLCQTALQHSNMLSIATFAQVSLGRILIEWNELDHAESHLKEAIRMGEISGFLTGNLSSATMMLAEIQEARGDSEGAAQTARVALAYAEKYDPAHERQWLKVYQARLFLNSGNLAAAEWTGTIEPSLFYPPQIQAVTRARVLLMQRKIEEAIVILTGLKAESLFTVEALLLLAIARQAQGDSVHAVLAMEQALARGARENRLRVFLDLRPTKLLERFPEHPFAQKLLTLMPSETQTSLEPLSEREREILRLIAAGYSNEEIAQTLTIAVSTVKWYINTLYAKLYVKSRSQAIARAHALKLLD